MNKRTKIYVLIVIAATLHLSASCKDEKVEANPLPNNPHPVFNIHIPPEPVSTEIPFEFDGLMIVIECQLNDMPCRMVLDTGAETITLFEDKLDKYHLKTAGVSSSGYSAAGNYKSKILEAFVLSFPSNIKVVSRYCSTIARFTDKPDIDGIIGGPVFKTLDAVIDYKKKTLTLNTAGR